jgi:MoxR-like ATPase
MDAAGVAAECRKIVDQIDTVIIGKHRTIELAAAALLARGHILIEDIPGVGKTTLAKALARSIGGAYKRIQFTPDLLPADITGVAVFNQKTTEFEFRPGPVFANVVLADEINRATPKTQSSLLECMEEHQATVDGVTHLLPAPFFVIATDNPIEYHGTYPLPEAQLDRFLMRLSIGYPRPAEEVTIMDRQRIRHPLEDVKPAITTDAMLGLQEEIKEVFIEPSIKDYIVALVGATREHPLVWLGSSPRGSLALMRCSQALAAMAGREFVLPDDVKSAAPGVLAHRLIMKPEAAATRADPAQVVAEILSSVPVPVLEQTTNP